MRIIPFVGITASLLALSVYLQSAIYFNENDGRQKIEQLKHAIAKERQKNQELTEINAQRRADLRKLENNPDYSAEILARKWLLMIKADEIYLAEPKTH